MDRELSYIYKDIIYKKMNEIGYIKEEPYISPDMVYDQNIDFEKAKKDLADINKWVDSLNTTKNDFLAKCKKIWKKETLELSEIIFIKELIKKYLEDKYVEENNIEIGSSITLHPVHVIELSSKNNISKYAIKDKSEQLFIWITDKDIVVAKEIVGKIKRVELLEKHYFTVIGEGKITKLKNREDAFNRVIEKLSNKK